MKNDLAQEEQGHVYYQFSSWTNKGTLVLKFCVCIKAAEVTNQTGEGCFLCGVGRNEVSLNVEL